MKPAAFQATRANKATSSEAVDTRRRKTGKQSDATAAAVSSISSRGSLGGAPPFPEPPPGDDDDEDNKLLAPFSLVRRNPSGTRPGECYVLQAAGPAKRYLLFFAGQDLL